MLTIFVRTLLIYAFLLLALRIMGKRQIGELEVTDLITTLLISEIASLPITNQDIPVSYALIPIATLLILEGLFSMVLVKLPRLRGLVSAKPTVIIRHGLLCQRALLSLRISVEELMSELKKNYTVVIVTHNMQQAARISDRTAFFLLGELVEAGPTAQIFSTPQDKRTEDYISGRFG